MLVVAVNFSITISTHTLTWSVTSPAEKGIVSDCISTHTLTWSVTRLMYSARQERSNFNSHAHVERDCCGRQFMRLTAISTHTLTWSVTGAFKTFDVALKISTHTLTWSVTEPEDEETHILFISTHTLTWSVTI